MAGILLRRSYRCAPWTANHNWLCRRTLTTIPVASSQGPFDLNKFRQDALVPEKPLLLQGYTSHVDSGIPAAKKWFDSKTNHFSAYMAEFHEYPFPYELVMPTMDSQDAVVAFRDWLLQSSDVVDQVLAGVVQSAISEMEVRSFHQLYAPLKLLVKALDFNRARKVEASAPLQLYIAQSLLSDLPQPLLNDVPTPDLVLHAGQGDVYSSSIWLGTEPTYTPLHRDPNPNLFCQLHSSKFLRLLPPTTGEKLFFQVQARIRQQANSRIRNVEMMEGKEREELQRAVWNPEEEVDLHEVEVEPGDALYIPKGWWHSVKSRGSEGDLNCSVNWWFR
jgi:hypothetical protein